MEVPWCVVQDVDDGARGPAASASQPASEARQLPEVPTLRAAEYDDGALAVGRPSLREAVYRSVAQLYITHPLYADASAYEQPHRACHTHCAHRESTTTPLALLSFPPSPPRTPHRIAPPTPINHHGLAQHVHQRAQHHPQLPERRQRSAAFRFPGTVAYIRTMGRLRGDCPTCQRVPARRRERERLEGPEHRRYVKSTRGHSIAAQQAH